MSSSPNNQDINPFASEEDFQIFEDNPEDTNEAQNMGEDDADEAVMDEWPGTHFTPINPPRRQVRAAARTPTPPDNAPPTPAAQSTTRVGLYFDRETRLRTRTAQVAAREGDFEGYDDWLAPNWPVERMSTIGRHIRQNILIRDARNRVARRPSALAPGGVPIGAGARDTSPTPAPRRRDSVPMALRLGTGRRAPAVPPRPAGARALGEARVPPMSVAQLTNQLGMSTMNDFAADGDDERSGDEQIRRVGGRIPTTQVSIRPRREYQNIFPDSRTLFVAPQSAWGRGGLDGRGISAYDSNHGDWNVHGFGTGAYRDNRVNPGWGGYYDARHYDSQSWSAQVPTVAQLHQANLQNAQNHHHARFVEASQAHAHAHAHAQAQAYHAHQYPEWQTYTEEEQE